MRMKVNCRKIDDLGFCDKLPKRFFGLFKRPCIEYGSFTAHCKDAERKPVIKSIPAITKKCSCSSCSCKKE